MVPYRNLAAHDPAGVPAVCRKAHAPVEQIQGAIGTKRMPVLPIPPYRLSRTIGAAPAEK
jgi:hypothetical protein